MKKYCIYPKGKIIDDLRGIRSMKKGDVYTIDEAWEEIDLI